MRQFDECISPTSASRRRVHFADHKFTTRRRTLQKVIFFLDNLDSLASESQINSALQDVLKFWKVEYFCFLRHPHDDQVLDDVILTQHVPPEWLDRYRRRNYLRIDAGLKFAAQTFLPFRHIEAPDPRGEAARLFEDLARHELGNAVMFPISGMAGVSGVAWLQGRDFNPHPQLVLHILLSYAFQRLGTKFNAPPRPLLSVREAEALAWAATGKSAWETGEILCITQRTVEDHLASAIRKLGAANRAHAVAIALRDRIITF